MQDLKKLPRSGKKFDLSEINAMLITKKIPPVKIRFFEAGGVLIFFGTMYIRMLSEKLEEANVASCVNKELHLETLLAEIFAFEYQKVTNKQPPYDKPLEVSH